MKRLLFAIATVLGTAMLLPPLAVRIGAVFDPDLADPRVFNCDYYRLINGFSSMSCPDATSHWLNYGIYEGRLAHWAFSAPEYVALYSDVDAATSNYAEAVGHYLVHGIGEGRLGLFQRNGWNSHFPRKVMNVSGDTLAYAFSATYNASWSPTYLGVFHAESWNCPVNRPGDSVAARYGTAYDFGSHERTSATTHNNQDLLIARTENNGDDWDCVPDPDFHNFPPSTNRMKGGAGNPQLIADAGGTFGFHWIGVNYDYATNLWRHYMFLALAGSSEMASIHSSYMWYLSTTPASSPNEAWGYWRPQWPLASGRGALVGQELSSPPPAPISETSSGNPIKSIHGVPDDVDSNGVHTHEFIDALLGSTTTGYGGTQYFYYVDRGEVSGVEHKILYRRTINNLAQFSAATPLIDMGTVNADDPSLIAVNYHATFGVYVAIYYCRNSSYPSLDDICVQTSSSPDLTGVSINATTDSTYYGVGLQGDPGIPRNSEGNYYLGQLGIRKDIYGRHFTDADGQVIVYFPIGSNVEDGGSAWGRSIYAKQIKIQ